MDQDRVKLYFERKRQNKAFRTKEGLDLKHSHSHSFKDDPTTYLRQVFEPNTWFCDIVNFGKYESKHIDFVAAKPIGYFMFVHANSRYIVLNTGNLIEWDNEVFEFTPTGLKTTQYFIEALTKIIQRYRIETLITDYEPGFQSEVANVFYQQHNIKHVPINVSKFGHRKLSILDRAVRTIRDMIYNTNSDASDPIQLQKLIEIYNNTRHKTLTKFNNTPTTPSMVFNNKELENEIILKTRTENYNILHNPNYEIPDGSEVVVKHLYLDRFEKHRRTAEDGRFVVVAHEGSRYVVKDIKTGELKPVFRSQIKSLNLSQT